MGARVVIVDDHEMMLDGLRTGLDQRPDLDVVGTAACVADYRIRFESWSPAIVIADFQLPDGSGLDVARTNRAAEPPIPTIIISGLQRRGLIHDVVAAGCQGLQSKTATIAELAGAIDVVLRGGTAFPVDELEQLARRDRTDVGDTLTPREREVLALLAQAVTAEQIAGRLDVSLNTVRKHIRSLLTKLHASSQLEAVIRAQRAGLV